MSSGKVAFKSKVVSRSHAEIWCEAGGKVSYLTNIRVETSSLRRSSIYEMRLVVLGHS